MADFGFAEVGIEIRVLLTARALMASVPFFYWVHVRIPGKASW
jgi:hypothetical protein